MNTLLMNPELNCINKLVKDIEKMYELSTGEDDRLEALEDILDLLRDAEEDAIIRHEREEESIYGTTVVCSRCEQPIQTFTDKNSSTEFRDWAEKHKDVIVCTKCIRGAVNEHD